MANENNFILAIALGSSKISAIVGRKEPDGAIKILASAQEASEAFIRKGRVNNMNKMTTCIVNLKEKLEKKLQKSIGCAYVGIGGMGVHTESNLVERQFAEKTTIHQGIIEEMNQSNRGASSNDREILDSIVQEYKLGTQQTTDPVGIQSESIEARFLNVVGHPSLCDDIRSCFKEAGIRIVGTPIAIRALAEAMLSDLEKSSGCALVDMGAETTTVAVYKNRLLRHMAVLPLGSANVNRDITSLQIEDAEAEALKLQYGEAVYDMGENKVETISLNDGRKVAFSEFSGLVEARMEEIIKNIDNQIKLSKYDKSSLIGGIFLVGGAAEMKNLEKAVRQYTGFSSVKLKKELNLHLRGSNAADLKKDFGYCTALAVLDQATENCCAGELGSPNTDLFDDEPITEETSTQNDPQAGTQIDTATVVPPTTGDTSTTEETPETPAPKKERFVGFKRFMKTLGTMVSEKEEE